MKNLCYINKFADIKSGDNLSLSEKLTPEVIRFTGLASMLPVASGLAYFLTPGGKYTPNIYYAIPHNLRSYIPILGGATSFYLLNRLANYYDEKNKEKKKQNLTQQ